MKHFLIRAKELSPLRATFAGKELPVVTPEAILLAIAERADLEIAQELLKSGINVAKLELVVRNPRQTGKDVV